MYIYIYIFAFIHFDSKFNNRTWVSPVLTLGCPYFFHITKKLDRVDTLFEQK